MSITSYRSGGTGVSSAPRPVRPWSRRPVAEAYATALAFTAAAPRDKCVQILGMFSVATLKRTAAEFTTAECTTAEFITANPDTTFCSGPPCRPA